jgi:hypothetical protein
MGDRAELLFNTYFEFIKALTHRNPFDRSRRWVWVKVMRNRIIKLLVVVPIALLIWMIGWAMSWAGADREQETRQTRSIFGTENESITVVPAVLEEPLHSEV